MSAGPGVEVTVTADRLVIGAGTFGSTFLLLRNRAAFPSLGPALGTRFSGNGDLLTFLLRSQAHRGRRGGATADLDPEFGPVITSAIRMPDTLDGHGPVGRGFYIEDGGNPAFLDWLVQATDGPGTTARVARFAAQRVWAHLRGSSTVQHQRQHLRVARRRSSLGRHDAGPGHGPRHPERNVPAARRES